MDIGEGVEIFMHWVQEIGRYLGGVGDFHALGAGGWWILGRVWRFSCTGCKRLVSILGGVGDFHALGA